MDITSRSRITIYAIAAAVPTLAWAMFWVAGVYYEGKANALAISDQKKEFEALKTDTKAEWVEQRKILQEVKEAVIEIKAHIKN